MPKRIDVHKPVYRFTVVDDTIHTWAVKDNLTGELVRKEVRSSWQAKDLAEQFNLNPELIDGENKEGSS